MHYANRMASGGTIAIYTNCNLFLLTRVQCAQQFNSSRLSPAEAEARFQLLGHMICPLRVPHPLAGKHSSCVRMMRLLTNPVTGSSGSPSLELGVLEHAD
jgi:hypothetical protein